MNKLWRHCTVTGSILGLGKHVDGHRLRAQGMMRQQRHYHQQHRDGPGLSRLPRFTSTYHASSYITLCDSYIQYTTCVCGAALNAKGVSNTCEQHLRATPVPAE